MIHWAEKFYPAALMLLRIVAGFLFWQHGAQKLLGWFGGEPEPFFSLLWFAGVLESLGGSLIALGLFTRPVALVLVGELLATYFIANLPQGFWPIRNRGEVALLFAFIYFHLVAAGPGKFCVDGLLSSKFTLQNLFSRFTPVTLPILRIATGVLFWQHGAQKMFGMLGGRPVEAIELRWFAGILEFFGGPLIALGLFTRPVAFLLSGEMATAFWISHVPRGPGFWPIQNAGERAVLFCFIYLFLVTAGAGKWSLDALRLRKLAIREDSGIQ